ncbi:MAG: hypothetical protein AB7F86_10100 [Bdellovibrionales bacterium]
MRQETIGNGKFNSPEIQAEVKSKLSELRQTTIDTLSQAKDKALEASQQAAKRVDQSARENVWKYIGAAAVLSACAGLLVGRKAFCKRSE